MKLAFVFFFVCGFLLSCSLQQQVLFRSPGWNPNIFQRIAPYYYYADQDADDSNQQTNNQLYEPSNNVQNRRALSTIFKSNSYKNIHPQGGLFRFLLFNQLKKSLFSSLPTVTFTSTSTSVSTAVSTITTLALQNCISSIYFVGAAPGVLSTTPCPGRKRSIQLDVAFEPSKVILMETSRIARDDGEQNSDSYVLSSSFLDLQEESDVVTPRITVGFSQASPIVVPKSTLVVTATTTTTSFFFVASTVKKPFTLGADKALTCLPPGFVVC